MLSLLPTTATAAAIMVFMRMSNGHVTNRSSMLAVNYLVCALLSWVHMGFGVPVPTGEGTAVTVSLGLLGFKLGSILPAPGGREPAAEDPLLHPLTGEPLILTSAMDVTLPEK